MRTESKRPPVLPQKTQASEKTAAQPKATATAAPAQPAAAKAELFATGFDAGPARRNVADPMPNAPLTDEQMTRAVDEALNLAVGGNVPAAQRNAWLEEGRKLKAEGKTANEIKWTLFNKINEAKEKSELAKPGAMERVVDEALELAGATSNPDLRKTAQEMAKQLKEAGKSASEIKWTVFNALTQAQDQKSLDGAGLEKAVDDAMELAGVNKNSPSRAAWIAEAKKMIEANNAQEGATPLGANDIKFALFNKMEAAKDAKLLTDEGLGKLLDEASELALNKKLSASARDAWLVEAKKLRDEGKTAVEIKWKLFNMLYP